VSSTEESLLLKTWAAAEVRFAGGVRHWGLVLCCYRKIRTGVVPLSLSRLWTLGLLVQTAHAGTWTPRTPSLRVTCRRAARDTASVVARRHQYQQWPAQVDGRWAYRAGDSRGPERARGSHLKTSRPTHTTSTSRWTTTSASQTARTSAGQRRILRPGHQPVLGQYDSTDCSVALSGATRRPLRHQNGHRTWKTGDNKRVGCAFR